MVGLGETYFPAFALALGASAFEAGLLTTVPLLVGAVFQLLAPYGARLIGNKRWVVASALLQSLTFVPIAWSSDGEGTGYAWLLVWVCVYWALALGINPAWNAWLGRLVPPSVRSSFFSRRTIPAQFSLFFSLLGGGFALHELSQSRLGAPAAFTVLFGMAMLCRWVSVGFLTRQIDPPGARPKLVRAGHILRRMHREPFGRVIFLIVCMHASVHVAAPYFTPYMLDHLGLSYGEFTILNGVVVVARILSASYWGNIARIFGNRRALQVSAVLLVPLAGMWSLSDSFIFLILLQLLAGFAWAGFELLVMLSFFDTTDEQTRARVLSIYNLLNGIAIVAGSLLGGLLLELTGPQGYLWVFVASSALRGLTVLFLARGAGVRREQEHDFERVFLRVISFRPGQGPGLRPVLVPSRRRGRPHKRRSNP